MCATHVICFDLKARDRVSPRRVGEHKIVVALVTIRLLSVFVNFDHAPPNRAALVLLGRLVKEIATAFRCFVVLQRVVGNVLPCLGEHHAIDLTVGSGANKVNSLIDFGEHRAHCGQCPLQCCITINRCFLMGKVIGFVPPFLQVDIPQMGTGFLNQFDRTQMQARCVGRRAVALVQHGRLSAFFQNDQRVGCVGAPF